MAYFDHHPSLILPSFSQNRSSSRDVYATKNLFKRGKIRDDFFENAIAFEKYDIIGDDRPDNVAEELYDDPELDWVVLLSNNIINVRDEWPMSQYDFQRFLNNKYSSEQLTSIHHYKTKAIKDNYGVLLLEEGLEVDSDFTFEYSQNGTNYSISGSDVLTSTSFYDYEVDKNDAKRNIFALRSNYIDVVISDLRDIMSYTNSSQYINKKLKSGDNIRV